MAMGGALQSSIQAKLDEAVAQGTARGVQVAAYHKGDCVVNAWAGAADAARRLPVTETTLFPVFSVTKGVATAIVHAMVERGALAYDTPIAAYWPTFGRNGKESITLREVLCHTAGLPFIPNTLTRETLTDWESMCGVMEGLTPTRSRGQMVYHAMTFGWLVGEIVRRVDGRPFERVFADRVAAPLGLDGMHMAWKGPDGGRIAWLTEAEDPQLPTAPYVSVPAAATPLTAWMNDPVVRASCLPATTGIMTAESLARFYASLLPGGVDGVQLLTPERVRIATGITEAGLADAGMLPMGFARGTDSPSFGRRDTAFGHGGYGGSVGWADPVTGVAFAFAHNHFSAAGDALAAQLAEMVLGAYT